MERKFQVRRSRPWKQAQRLQFFLAECVGQVERIKTGGQVTSRPVGRDQFEDSGLLLGLDAVHCRRDGRGKSRRPLALCGFNARNRIGMGDFRIRASLQAPEEIVPARRDAARVSQPALIQIFNEGCIAAGECGRTLELLQ